MNEKTFQVVPPGVPGGKTPPQNNGPVAGTAKPSAAPQPLPSSDSPRSSQPLFGGHKGGGKKRADGLVAGSPEAIQADKDKNAERMRLARAAEKNSAVPPPLPSVVSPAGSPNVPATAGGNALPAAVAGVALSPAVVAVAGPAVVPWTEKVLQRPVRLLTKILDRVRTSSLMQRIRKLDLTKDQEKEIEGDIAYKAEVLADFNNAVANCAAIEMNKRNVAGAQHSHWLDVVFTGGELVNLHLSTVDKLEKMVAENLRAKTGKAEIK